MWPNPISSVRKTSKGAPENWLRGFYEKFIEILTTKRAGQSAFYDEQQPVTEVSTLFSFTTEVVSVGVNFYCPLPTALFKQYFFPVQRDESFVFGLGLVDYSPVIEPGSLNRLNQNTLTTKLKKMCTTLTERKYIRHDLIAHPKQLLKNYVEQFDKKYLHWHFYESDGYYNVEILGGTTEFMIREIVTSIPAYLMMHINPITNRLEFFIDKD